MRIKECLVIAKPFLCFPAILETTLKYFGINKFDQERIATFFKINVPNEFESQEAYYYKNAAPNNWGVEINESTIISFFEENDIPLKEIYISIFGMRDGIDLVDSLKMLLMTNSVIICGFSYSALFEQGKDTYGHVSIISGLAKEHNTIILLDPGPKNPGEKMVNCDDLFSAIKKKHAGLWVISPRDEE